MIREDVMAKPIDLILDTDVGADCDDMLALAYLIYAEKRGLVRLRAVGYSNGCPDGVAAIRTLFRDLGASPPPIGQGKHGLKTYDRYCGEIVSRFGREEDLTPAEAAVAVLRRGLSESDGAVICGIGPLTNLAALLESGPDGISPLGGTALVKEKCRCLVLMAGTFPEHAEDAEPEWNAKLDAAATRIVVERSPVPIVFLPFETGADMITGGPVMAAFGETRPLSLSFLRFPGALARGGRHSWDPAAVLYAVEGEADLLEACLRGTVRVDGAGRTLMEPAEDGPHSVLRVKKRAGMDEDACKAAVAAYLDECVMELCNGSAFR